jgi:hypothetical protein
LARPERRCSEGFQDAAAALPEALRQAVARMGPLKVLPMVVTAVRSELE